MNASLRVCLSLAIIIAAPPGVAADELQTQPDSAQLARYQKRESGASSQIKELLLTLRKEIQEDHLNFTVGYTSALDWVVQQPSGTQTTPDSFADSEEKAVTTDRSSNDVGVELNEEKLRSAPVTVFDYRSKKKVTPVRDQGGIWAGWAFATVAALESSYVIRHPDFGPGDIDMSERDLIFCTVHSIHKPQDAVAYLTNPNSTWNTTKPFNAITNESYYPYPASAKLVITPTPAPADHCLNKTRPYAVDTSGSVGVASTPTKDEIKTALREHGPLITTLYASRAFMGYTGGLFNERKTHEANHSVTIVGYADIQLPQANIPPVTMWIIKNSMGTDWGIGGYGLIVPGSNRVGKQTIWLKGKELTAPAPSPTATGIPASSPRPMQTPTATAPP